MIDLNKYRRYRDAGNVQVVKVNTGQSEVTVDAPVFDIYTGAQVRRDTIVLQRAEIVKQIDALETDIVDLYALLNEMDEWIQRPTSSKTYDLKSVSLKASKLPKALK